MKIHTLRERFHAEFEFPLEELDNVYRRVFSAIHEDAEGHEVSVSPSNWAALSAGVKNYKTSQMLIFILHMTTLEPIDLTPTVVKKLCKGFFGRVGSQNKIVAIFSEPGREHKSRDASEDKIKKILAENKSAAKLHREKFMLDISYMKLKFKKERI
jgi:hypothetical protein